MLTLRSTHTPFTPFTSKRPPRVCAVNPVACAHTVQCDTLYLHVKHVCGDASVFCPEGSSAPTAVSEGFYTVQGTVGDTDRHPWRGVAETRTSQVQGGLTESVERLLFGSVAARRETVVEAGGERAYVARNNCPQDIVYMRWKLPRALRGGGR